MLDISRCCIIFCDSTGFDGIHLIKSGLLKLAIAMVCDRSAIGHFLPPVRSGFVCVIDSDLLFEDLEIFSSHVGLDCKQLYSTGNRGVQ